MLLDWDRFQHSQNGSGSRTTKSSRGPMPMRIHNTAQKWSNLALIASYLTKNVHRRRSLFRSLQSLTTFLCRIRSRPFRYVVASAWPPFLVLSTVCLLRPPSRPCPVSFALWVFNHCHPEKPRRVPPFRKEPLSPPPCIGSGDKSRRLPFCHISLGRLWKTLTWYWFLPAGIPSLSVADPDPYVFGPPVSGSLSQRCGSFYHNAKIIRKILIPTVLWLLFHFLSLKNDVKVPSKR